MWLDRVRHKEMHTEFWCGSLFGNIHSKRLRRKWEYNIKMDIVETGCDGEGR
jgi:hypothetical protein